MKASKHLREAIFATLQQTANDLEAQRQATEYAFRKRIHETNQTKSELEWQQNNVSTIYIARAMIGRIYHFHGSISWLSVNIHH